jgi:hypothetical protein
MKHIGIVIILSAIGFMVQAQAFQPYAKKTEVRRGPILLLGPLASYYKGPGSRAITPLKEEMVNWQANAQLGYLFNPEKRLQGNLLAAFGTAGVMNNTTLRQLFDDQEINTSSLVDRSANVYYQLEAGFYISEILRMSSGIGRQQYRDADGDHTLHYFSSTVGLSINLGSINWVVDFNWLYGSDFNQLVLRPSTGFLVKF